MQQARCRSVTDHVTYRCCPPGVPLVRKQRDKPIREPGPYTPVTIPYGGQRPVSSEQVTRHTSNHEVWRSRHPQVPQHTPLESIGSLRTCTSLVHHLPLDWLPRYSPPDVGAWYPSVSVHTPAPHRWTYRYLGSTRRPNPANSAPLRLPTPAVSVNLPYRGCIIQPCPCLLAAPSICLQVLVSRPIQLLRLPSINLSLPFLFILHLPSINLLQTHLRTSGVPSLVRHHEGLPGPFPSPAAGRCVTRRR